MVQSIVIRLGEGKKVTTMLRRWSSRGLGALEVMTVPALTGNIMPSSSLEGKQLPDRPKPGQIARDRSLKKTNIKYKTRGASDMKKVPLHDRINRFSGQHLMTGPEGNSEFCFPRISMFPETKSRETLSTTLIFLEIFLIECCTVLVEPPMMSSLSSFA